VIELTLFSKPECHLCDELMAELLPLISGRAEVKIVDISQDPELMRRYGLLIPVLKAGDEVLARYRLDAERLAEYLERQTA